MKTRQSRRQTANVSHTRWLAYAIASAATVLAGSNCLEAAIHYSGRLDVPFPPHADTLKTFPLDPASDYLKFQKIGGFAGFAINHGSNYAGFRGFPNHHGSNGIYYVSKLRFGQNIIVGRFSPANLW